MRSLRLSGLGVAACKQLLVERGVAPKLIPGVGTEADQERLIALYEGNPLALKIVADTIVDLFGGEIGTFLANDTVIFSSIADLLGEHFARLSALEQSVLCWLAIAREPMTLDELLSALVVPLPHVQLLEAFDGLRRRSLIERGERAGSFTLQSVVLEYVTAHLVAEGSREVQLHRLDKLIQYGLSQAKAPEYVRQTQERLLISQLLAVLENAYRSRGKLEDQLLSLLNQLRKEADDSQGYGPANLIALLRVLRGHLSDLDLSQLFIRGAHLQGIEMQDASMAGALIRDCVWTYAVNATYAVAISLDGKLWAAGSLQGKVLVWEGVRSQTLRLSLSAHTDAVQVLTFSPDGKTLASGSLDGTIKLWDLDSGTLLWAQEQRSPFGLAFTPDGSLLASGGKALRLWDSHTGTNLQTLTHPTHVFAVAWSPDGSLLASGSIDGKIRLWERQKGAVPTFALCLSMQTNWVASLAFDPSGKTLASTSWRDQTVKLWEVGSHGASPRGQLLHTLPGYTDKSRCVAWSPDGRTLAYCRSDKAIWLWDVEEGRYRAVLYGHTADVYGMAFTPDGNGLLSGSADNALRMWDVESCRCMHVMDGYAVSFWNLDWSPDSLHLICGRTDALVTLWDLSGGMPSRILQGHTWIVQGVGWSPDGRFLASCSLDGVLLLWDSTSFSCVQKFDDPSVTFVSMAWSPDGSLLACGTYQRGIQVWDMTTRIFYYVGQIYQTPFHCVTWSPNGEQLVSGGEGCVYLWERTDGTGQEQAAAPTKFSGHHGWVKDVKWSPDGRWLASCGGNGDCGELFVWDVQSAGVVVTTRDHPYSPCPMQTFAVSFGIVHALAWTRSHEASPGENQLVSGGCDGMLRWWDVESGQCVRTQEAHQGTIQALKVSPDGRWLASCGGDGAIVLWDVDSGKHVRTLRHSRPYERLNITGITGLTEAQKSSLQALGAIDNTEL